ncbi:hypothetical protein EVAR_68736_1 [Eumeta japonica]|uniref:Uncharacterized protein n=1 Tax=Eumeta variegata TaxID=151549 RepID=A0A4C2AHP6_EUMVA|nr:hypothetical protein EVAR_68736_1 [Eumeta japonica]
MANGMTHDDAFFYATALDSLVRVRSILLHFVASLLTVRPTVSELKRVIGRNRRAGTGAEIVDLYVQAGEAAGRKLVKYLINAQYLLRVGNVDKCKKPKHERDKGKLNMMILTPHVLLSC